jgi:hypothetical protein
MIFGSMGALTGVGTGSFKDAAMVAASQAAASPFAMGLVSAASGDVSRGVANALANPLIQQATSAALGDYFNQNGGGLPPTTTGGQQ